MADDDIRICPACGKIYVEDSFLQLDPDVCPNCGFDLAAYIAERRGEDEP